MLANEFVIINFCYKISADRDEDGYDGPGAEGRTMNKPLSIVEIPELLLRVIKLSTRGHCRNNIVVVLVW